MCEKGSFHRQVYTLYIHSSKRYIYRSISGSYKLVFQFILSCLDVHRLWVNFHTEGSRPRTGVIFGACKCCDQGHGAPCKSWRRLSKKCKKKVTFLGDCGIYQNSRRATFGASFSRSGALHLCSFCSPWDMMHNSIFPPAIGDLERFLLLFSGRGEDWSRRGG